MRAVRLEGSTVVRKMLFLAHVSHKVRQVTSEQESGSDETHVSKAVSLLSTRLQHNAHSGPPPTDARLRDEHEERLTERAMDER